MVAAGISFQSTENLPTQNEWTLICSQSPSLYPLPNMPTSVPAYVGIRLHSLHPWTIWKTREEKSWTFPNLCLNLLPAFHGTQPHVHTHAITFKKLFSKLSILCLQKLVWAVAQQVWKTVTWVYHTAHTQNSYLCSGFLVWKQNYSEVSPSKFYHWKFYRLLYGPEADIYSLPLLFTLLSVAGSRGNWYASLAGSLLRLPHLFLPSTGVHQSTHVCWAWIPGGWHVCGTHFWIWGSNSGPHTWGSKCFPVWVISLVLIKCS